MKNYFIVILFILNLFTPVSATSLRPISLEQLSTRAEIIFYGEAINNEVKNDDQSKRVVTFTTFKIIDPIKGKTEALHTIKQIGGADKSSNTRRQIHGVPTFEIGKQYVVFLPQKSKLGFSSPLGLHQGSFLVKEISGENIVSNGRDLSQPTLQKRTTQIPLAVDINKPTQTQLDSFINTIRTFNKP